MVKKLEQDEGMYFVAVVPPGKLRKQLMDLKEYFRDKYNASKSLNSPPHITLHMPFRWKRTREDELRMALAETAQTTESFELQLDGFDAFPPRVIYARPVESAPLRKLQKSVAKSLRSSLNIFNADYQNRGFHPHITLAFRDLKKSRFEEAWQEFATKPFQATFEVDKVCLLKHNGKAWDILEEVPLKALTSESRGEHPAEETE